MMAARCLFAAQRPIFRSGSEQGEIMAGAMTAVAIAIGGASLICVALVARLQRRSAVGRSSRNSYGADAGGGDDFAAAASHSHSSHSDHSGSDHSGGSSDAGDGGGSGDGGGDGGGGGGGSD
jgi:hypothetical protein